MKKILITLGLISLTFMVFPSFYFVQAGGWDASNEGASCENGVELNTDIGQYIGGAAKDGCIEPSKMDQGQGATLFGNTVAGLGKFLVQILVLVAFGLVILGWVMIASSGAYEEWYAKGKAMVMKAIIGLILLWLMGTILYWLNPNFFKI